MEQWYPILISRLPDNKVYLKSSELGFLNLVEFLHSEYHYEKALKRAVHRGQTEVVKFFVDTYPDCLKYLPMYFRGHLSILKIIYENTQVNLVRYLFSMTRHIVRYGHLDSLEYMIKRQVLFGEVIIIQASQYDHPEILQFLVNIYPNLKNIVALEYAISHELPENVLILLNAGAKLDKCLTSNSEIKEMFMDYVTIPPDITTYFFEME